MEGAGYYRFPTIYGDRIVFVSEDDLWEVAVDGGVARRLTANVGAISNPFFSPDGAVIAFTGREEGHSEVYLMAADGGPVRRITFLGVNSSVIGWTPDGGQILFASDHEQPFARIMWVHSVSPDGGPTRRYPVGPAVSISVTHEKRTVIGRNNNDPARWKRYRGGTAGDIWVDSVGDGGFRRLLQVNGNAARPMWIGDRIYFISDHNGMGNLYSCTPDGDELRRETDQRDYFVRFPNTDGMQIVYQAGGDLYVFDPRLFDPRLSAADGGRGTARRVDIRYHSPWVHRQRRFNRGRSVPREL